MVVSYQDAARSGVTFQAVPLAQLSRKAAHSSSATRRSGMSSRTS
ncbi:hypothetical protein WJ973_23545 [Achromobacter xylosoxidans]